jgi:signal transduction histidine kinase/CheY-like chemotaxis protein
MNLIPESDATDDFTSGNIFLYIKDEEKRNRFDNLLTKYGFEVRFADEEQDGIGFDETNIPDLILLGITEDSMRNLDRFRKIRKKFSSDDIPVMIITDHGENLRVFLKQSGEINENILFDSPAEEIIRRILLLLTLSAKNRKLRQISEELEIILEGTQQITMQRDPLMAAIVACALIRKFLGREAVRLKGIYLPRSFLKIDGYYIPHHPIEGFTLLTDDPGEEAVQTVGEVNLATLESVSVGNGNLWIPVRSKDVNLALLSFEGVLSGKFNRERKFIISLVNSLALIIGNMMHAERIRLAQIGQMTSGLIHDLKNYVVSIRNSAKFAIDERLSETEKKMFVDIMHHESEQMLAMVQDILDFAKDEIHVFPEVVNLANYMTNMEKSLLPLFMDKPIRFSMGTIPDVSIRLDRNKFQRAIYNIAGNAINAMTGGGEFRIGCNVNDRRVDIAFTDTGKGISEDIKERIFDPFITGDKNTGTGLGMTITKSIVEAHGGSIHFETGPTGTCFFISLPVV